MNPHRILPALIGFFAFCSAAYPQIDPKRRQLFQFGYNQPIQGKSPIAGYLFYYHNQPKFYKNLTLRLAVAPVALDADLGIRGFFGEKTDVSVGLSGGGFADSYSEIRQGNHRKEESFTGHASEMSLNVYHRFNPRQVLPVYLVAKAMAHYTVFKKDASNPPGFSVPPDHLNLKGRTGLRVGGKEPTIFPRVGMELSVWHETQWRSARGTFGYKDRELEEFSHLFRGRMMFAYTLPQEHRIELMVTTGSGTRLDRFSAFRLGGELPLREEFPLDLPGYYYQEISADRFILFGGYYTLPLEKKKRFGLTFFGDHARVNYLKGFEQPGDRHTGVGGALTFFSPGRAWKIIAGYAYGFNAIRDSGRGSHAVGVLLEFDFLAFRGEETDSGRPDANPNKSRWLNRYFR